MHAVTAEKRYHETADDGCDETDCGAHAGGDAEGNCQRKSYDAYDNAGCDVGLEAFGSVAAKALKEFRMKVDRRFDYSLGCLGRIHFRIVEKCHKPL